MKRLIYTPLITILLLVAMAISFSMCGREETSPVEKGLKTLDAAIKNADRYTVTKRLMIDSLKNVALSEKDSIKRWETLLQLSSEYRVMNADSAVFVATKAIEEAPVTLTDEQRLLGKLIYIRALGTSGLFYAAISRLDSIDCSACSLPTKIEYWKTARTVYSYAASYAEGIDSYVSKLISYQDQAKDSLMKYLPQDNLLRRFLYCSDLVHSSNWDRAKKELTQFLNEVPESENFHGMIAYQLAQAYKNQGDFNNYVIYLAEAAKSDILSNVKEGIALHELARWQYQQGDYERANSYITMALSDATSGNARMRTAAISNIAPLIEETNHEEIKRSHQAMRIYAVTSTILFILTAALAFIFLRNSRRIRANEKKLSSSTKKLEAYVGNFIALCSNYSSRLDSLTKLVARKITSGQADELLKMINSGKISEEDSEEFYSLVDKALLDLYPDFVENINTLLEPDQRIKLKDGELLNPELRIYAFIRLGITQSTKISQILQYSSNTVYSYRNRMRKRALDRDNFEIQVANLGIKENWIDHLPE